MRRVQWESRPPGSSLHFFPPGHPWCTETTARGAKERRSGCCRWSLTCHWLIMLLSMSDRASVRAANRVEPDYYCRLALLNGSLEIENRSTLKAETDRKFTRLLEQIDFSLVLKSIFYTERYLTIVDCVELRNKNNQKNQWKNLIWRIIEK